MQRYRTWRKNVKIAYKENLLGAGLDRNRVRENKRRLKERKKFTQNLLLKRDWKQDVKTHSVLMVRHQCLN